MLLLEEKTSDLERYLSLVVDFFDYLGDSISKLVREPSIFAKTKSSE